MSQHFTYNSVSVRAIIRRHGALLVEWLPSKAIAFLPGGAVENGEDLAEALKRELNEEISGPSFCLGAYRGSIGHRWQESSCLNHFFEVELIGEEEVSPREHGRFLRWMMLSLEDANSLKPPSLKTLLGLPVAGVWEVVDNE